MIQKEFEQAIDLINSLTFGGSVGFEDNRVKVDQIRDILSRHPNIVNMAFDSKHPYYGKSRTLLYCAIHQESVEAVKLLLEYEADVNKKDPTSVLRTPLEIAAGRISVDNYSNRVEITALLLKNGAKPQKRAAMIAVESGMAGCLKLILRYRSLRLHQPVIDSIHTHIAQARQHYYNATYGYTSPVSPEQINTIAKEIDRKRRTIDDDIKAMLYSRGLPPELVDIILNYAGRFSATTNPPVTNSNLSYIMVGSLAVSALTGATLLSGCSLSVAVLSSAAVVCSVYYLKDTLPLVISNGIDDAVDKAQSFIESVNSRRALTLDPGLHN